jgi:hypothetical protein
MPEFPSSQSPLPQKITKTKRDGSNEGKGEDGVTVLLLNPILIQLPS